MALLDDIIANLGADDPLRGQAPVQTAPPQPAAPAPAPAPTEPDIAPRAQPTWGDTAITSGLRVGGGLLGSIVGSVVPAAGTALGGATGSILGDIAAQAYERSHNLRPDYSLREAATSGVIGALPGASLTRSGTTAAAIGKEALRSAALGAGATAIGTLGNKGELPSLGEAATGAALGVGAAGLGSLAERAFPARPPLEPQPPRSNIPPLADLSTTPEAPAAQQLNMFPGETAPAAPPPTEGPQGSLPFPERPLAPDSIHTGGVRGAIRQMVSRIFPEELSAQAQRGQEGASAHLAEQRTRTFGLAADPEFQAAKATLDKLPPDAQITFARIADAEGPQGFQSPEEQQIASLVRRVMQPRGLTAQRNLPPDAMGILEDYYAPAFKDPEAYKKAFRREQAIGFPSLPSFTKTRSMNLSEALQFAQAHNLELETYNPLRWTEGSAAIQDHFNGLAEWMHELRATGEVRPFDGDVRFMEGGYAPVDPRAVKILGGGEWIAPEGLAKIINNKFAPDNLRPYWQGVANASALLNQARVAVDLYHGVRSIGSGIAQLAAQSAKLAVAGDLEGAAKSNIINALRRGGKVIGEFRGAGIHGENITPDMATAIAGGLTPEPELAVSFAQHMKDVLSDSSHGLPTNVFRAALDASSALVMRTIVPRVKMGVYLLGMDAALAKNPNISPEEFRALAQSMRRLTDDVFGHIAKDNLGMSKTATTALRGFIGFPSWNLGKARLYANAVGGAKAILSNQTPSPDQTKALEFAAGVVMTHMMAGALIHRAMSGQWPTQITDFYSPKTGKKLGDGSDERLYLPTFLVDAVRLAEGPGRALKSKQSPLLSIPMEILHNADALGIQVYDPNANGFARAGQVAAHAAKAAGPFFLSDLTGEGPPPANVTDNPLLNRGLGVLGFSRAPAHLSRTLAEQTAAEARGSQFQGATQTSEGAQIARLRNTLRETLQNNPDQLGPQLADALRAGQITPAGIKTLLREFGETAYVTRFKNLDVANMERVLRQEGDPAKRAQLLPYYLRKKAAEQRGRLGLGLGAPQ